MKRMIMTLVAALSMGMTFAAEVNTAEMINAAAYDMSVNIRKLGSCLGLTFDQMEVVDDVHNAFCGDMRMASAASREERNALVDKAVVKNLKHMRYILNKKQYTKYAMLINNTIDNRGLKK